MSSLRNAVQRRNHKERSQLSHRAKFGILEKHKDYVLRAKDYHSKQDRIRRLKQKATDKNKDEFYFGMVNQRTQRGVHVQDRGNVAMPLDIVKLLKTQDENYIRSMRTLGLKKIDRLKAQLTALADLVSPHVSGHTNDDNLDLDDAEVLVLKTAGIVKGKGKLMNSRRKGHILFVDTEEDANKYMASSSSVTLDDQAPQETIEEVDLGWKSPPRKKSKGSGTVDASGNHDEARVAGRQEEAKNHRTRLLKELAARLMRDTQFRYAERELEMQRQLMGKGGSKKIQGLEKVEGEEDEDSDGEFNVPKRNKTADEKAYKPKVYKWRMERKR